MKKIDQEELKKRGADLREALTRGAERAFGTAADLTKAGYEAAAPRIMEAVDVTVKKTAPLVDSASQSAAKLTHKAGDALERFHEDVVTDYLPRITGAVEEAAARTRGELARVSAPSAEELAAIEKVARRKRRRRRCRKTAKWTLLAGATVGVAYLVWRRSQPVEDPWAEEYWSDLETDVDVTGTPVETPVVVEETVTETEEDQK